MQALFRFLFVSNLSSVAIIVLIIASIYLFNQMMKHYKITINFKKIHLHWNATGIKLISVLEDNY